MQNRKQLTGKTKQKIDINHVAKLANLELTATEKKKFAAQLSEILDYIEKLSEVNIKKVKPLAHAAGLTNVWREDVAIPSLSTEDVLKNAKQRHEDFFKVKAIFDEI